MALSFRPVATLLLAIGVAACADSPTGSKPGGPGSPRYGRISVQPAFSPAAQFASQHLADFGLDYDSVRVVVRSLPGLSVVKDTTIQFTPNSAPLVLGLTVPVDVDFQSFDATATYQLIGAPIFSGHAAAPSHPTAASVGSPTQISLDYAGPGSQAQRISINPNSITVQSTQTLAFAVTAM